MAQVELVLQQKALQIENYTPFLPKSPQNSKQKNASIYRDGQLDILRSVSLSLSTYLSEQTSLGYLLTVRQAFGNLEKANQQIFGWLNNGLTEMFGTDDYDALQASSWEEVLWVLWACTARIHDTRRSDENEPVSSSGWLSTLEFDQKDVPSAAAEQVLEIMELITKADEAGTSGNEGLFKGWTPEFVWWGVQVVQEETLSVHLMLEDSSTSSQIVLCERRS
jgi:hypothetical protein